MKRLKTMLTPTFILEACALLGLVGIGVSVWLIHWQLTFGVVGCLLLAGSVHGAWRKVKPNRRTGP